MDNTDNQLKRQNSGELGKEISDKKKKSELQRYSFNPDHSGIMGAAENSEEMGAIGGTSSPAPQFSSGDTIREWLGMTRDWLSSFRSTADPSVYVSDQTDGMDASDGDAEVGGATGFTEYTGDEAAAGKSIEDNDRAASLNSFPDSNTGMDASDGDAEVGGATGFKGDEAAAGKSIEDNDRAAALNSFADSNTGFNLGASRYPTRKGRSNRVPHNISAPPGKRESKPKPTRPASTNVRRGEHGCSLEKLKEVIDHICSSTTWTQSTVNNPSIWYEGPVSQGKRTWIFGARSNRKVAPPVVPGEKLRKIFEINADPSEQGGIVYGGKRDGQKGWMAIIETKKEKRSAKLIKKKRSTKKTKQGGGGVKRKSKAAGVSDKDDVLYHEVEHILAATLKTLFFGGCPGCPGRERLKQAIMESIAAATAAASGSGVPPSDKHVYRVEQLMQIYENIFKDNMGSEERKRICIQHILYERLMDILFIKPEILACNQFKCSLNMLKPLFTRRGSYPALTLGPDGEEIRKIACRMVVGEDTIELAKESPLSSGDYVRQKTRPFGGKVCAAKTLLDPTARYDKNQPYGSPQGNLHTSGDSFIRDTDVNDVIDKLVVEFTKNTQSICDIFNSLDEIERQLLVAHSIILACINYSLISSDIIPGIGYPDWRMPLMACVKSSLEFIGDTTLTRPTMANTVRTCQNIMTMIGRLPFVNPDMHNSHWEHLRSPIYPGFSETAARGLSLSDNDVTAAQAANPAIPCPPIGPPALIGVQGGGLVPAEMDIIKDPRSFPSKKDLRTEKEKELDHGGIATPKRQKINKDPMLLSSFEGVFDSMTKLLQEDYGEEGLDSEKNDMLLSALFTGEILEVSNDIRSGFKKTKKKKRKKKKKSPIKTKRRDQKKAKGRRSVTSSSKKKKKKRKQTKRKKKKSSRKIIIDISGLRESLS